MSTRTVRRLLAAITAGVAVLVLVSACGSSSKPTTAGGSNTSSAPAASGNTIAVKNFSFGPQRLTVNAGTTVTWQFDDTAKHTATSTDGKFDSKALGKGQSFSFTFNTPGTYNYICSIHQYMTGSVIVQ